MELEDAEASALAHTKAVHVALLVVIVPGAVWFGSFHNALFPPFLVFLLGGVAESFVPGASAAQTAKRVGKALGAWLLGFLGFMVVFALAAA